MMPPDVAPAPQAAPSTTHQAVLPSGEVMHFPLDHTPEMMQAAVQKRLATAAPDPAVAGMQNLTHHLQATAQTMAESLEALQQVAQQMTGVADRLEQAISQMVMAITGASTSLSTAMSGAIAQLSAQVSAASTASAEIAKAAGQAHAQLAGSVLATVPATADRMERHAGELRQGVEALRGDIAHSTHETTKALRAPRRAVQDDKGWSTVVDEG